MSTTEIVCISSSPSVRLQTTNIRIPSSPSLPSPSSLLRQTWHPLKTGSGTAGCLLGATEGLCTANVLARGIPLELDVASEVDSGQAAGEDGQEPQKQIAHVPSVSKVAKKKKIIKRSDGPKLRLDRKPVERKSRKLKEVVGGAESRADVTILRTTLDTTDDGEEQQVKVKKPRKRKEKPDGQTRLREAKVTKPGVSGSPNALKAFRYPAGQERPIPVSEHFLPKCRIGRPDQPVMVTDPALHLALEPAVRRRKVWTPTRDTEAILPVTHPNCPPKTAVLPPSNPAFAILRGSFSFTEGLTVVDKPVAIWNEDGESLSKRRRIEVVHSVSVTPFETIPAKKTKIPAKSSRTVTGAAINQFKVHDAESENKSAHTGFFSPHDIQVAEARRTKCKTNTGAGPQRRKPLAKLVSEERQSVKKTTSKPKKKAAALVPKLLSPETAIRKMDRQDFLFGTSSQLVREESPSFIRDWQQAIKVSEAVALHLNDALKVERDTNLRSLQNARALWDIGARGEDDTLLPAEPPPEPKMPFASVQAPEKLSMASGFASIENVTERYTEATKNPVRRSKLHLAQPTKSRLSLACVGRVASHTSTTDRLVLQPLPTNALVFNQNSTIEPTFAEKAVTDQDPKPSSSRARKKVAAPPSETVQQDPASIPKKPRGRPRKDTTSDDVGQVPSKKIPKRKKASAAVTATSQKNEWTAIDEIEDSDPGPTSSPPRWHSPSKLKELDFAAPSEPPLAQSIKQDQAAMQAVLFPQITKAVKAAPRLTDPSKPSWYEKMLMYDPIVLEDLTAWLNGGALRGAGRLEDGGVKAQLVQKWCEEHSVCCLWRDGVRGGAKLRY